MSSPTYIRFVVGAEGEHHRRLSGLISEARQLLDDGALEAYKAELLEDVYLWFNQNLPCPPFSTSGWGRDCVCWFKDFAMDSIGKRETRVGS